MIKKWSKKRLIMSLIGNVYSFKFFIDSLGCLCSKEEVGHMPRRCAAKDVLQSNCILAHLWLC